jgi:hypothetical protein
LAVLLRRKSSTRDDGAGVLLRANSTSRGAAERGRESRPHAQAEERRVDPWLASNRAAGPSMWEVAGPTGALADPADMAQAPTRKGPSRGHKSHRSFPLSIVANRVRRPVDGRLRGKRRNPTAGQRAIAAAEAWDLRAKMAPARHLIGSPRRQPRRRAAGACALVELDPVAAGAVKRGELSLREASEDLAKRERSRQRRRRPPGLRSRRWRV